MARITTIDCERVVPNRFELVLRAAARARALARGATPRVSPASDKPTVIALREIAAGALVSDEQRDAPLSLAWRSSESPTGHAVRAGSTSAAAARGSSVGPRSFAALDRS